MPLVQPAATGQASVLGTSPASSLSSFDAVMQHGFGRSQMATCGKWGIVWTATPETAFYQKMPGRLVSFCCALTCHAGEHLCICV